MQPPLMINLAEGLEKPRYVITMRQAHNGFAIEVVREIINKGPMSPEEAQRKIAGFMKNLNEKMASGSQDPMLDKILSNAMDEEEAEKMPIIGLHVFKTMSEMIAFISLVYEENTKV